MDAADIDQLARRCAAAGFDLIHPFALSAFNDQVAVPERLPDFGRASCLAVVVGNTRRLWPLFLEALRCAPEKRQARHPLDDYAVETITGAAASTGLTHAIFWAHVVEPKAIPIQRIAAAAGLAVLAPSYLSVHPTYGPWFALRAVVVFDAEAPAASTPPATQPCATCVRPCLSAFQVAMQESNDTAPAPLDAASVANHWQRWVAVRDACPVGRTFRYSDDQIEYHYAKRREHLG